MIACDSCNEWFHGECIGITQEMASRMTKYWCKECRDEKQGNIRVMAFWSLPYKFPRFLLATPPTKRQSPPTPTSANTSPTLALHSGEKKCSNPECPNMAKPNRKYCCDEC